MASLFWDSENSWLKIKKISNGYLVWTCEGVNETYFKNKQAICKWLLKKEGIKK